MYLEIVTPDTTVFEGEVASVRIPGKKGSFQVLKDHADIVSTLEKGPLTIVKDDGSKETFNTDGGVVEMQKNKIILLVEKILE
ncbi:MAG: ATP synthase F1 subunit epsilon [Bacteroidales bacterium]|nr:ATP synthase F1 subunit epsilon [Bacteroidales bacterium]